MTSNNDLNVDCPICGDGTMEYRKIENQLGTGLDEKGEPATHIWICNTCPGILMEWYDHSDTLALDVHLHREDGIHR